MSPALARATRWALVALGGWLAVGAVLGLLAIRDVQRGIDAAEAARANLSPSALVDGRAIDDLGRARQAFAAGHDKTSGPLTAPLRVLPIVGRNVRSVAALSEAAALVADVGVGAVADAGAVLDQPQDSGADRIRAARAVADIAGQARRGLADVDLGPTNLLGPLAAKRAQFSAELDQVRTTLDRARDAGAAVGDLLAGPRTYLLLAANNAEMRAGSGMFLSVGTLEVADGTFALGELEPSGELYLDEQQAPPLTGDLADRWGWLQPNREWRNLGVSPRFDATAALAARMWEARTGVAVDGVLAIDAEALRGVIAATGPVAIDGRTIEARSVLDFVLHDQYAEVGDDLDRESQAPRREQLGRIAKAAVAAVESGDFEIATMAEQLGGAVGGRHLMAWSARSDEQRGWEAAGVAGALEEGDLLAAVINRAGNKLDWFLDTTATIELDRTESGTDVTVRLELANTTPAGEVRYVAGPYPGSGAGEGVYAGLVALSLPGAARNGRIDGHDLAAAGPDGPTRVIAAPLTLARGERTTVTARFRLPAAVRALRVVPNARIPATGWAAGGRRWRGDRPHEVRW